MTSLKLINKCGFELTIAPENHSSLHEDMLDLLFKHKEEIHKKLIDLRGIFLVDHFSINIIDPSNKLLIFSMTPSVEYNLIMQGLWAHDQSFSREFNQKNNFYSWDKAYLPEHFHNLKQIKETKHGFNCSFNISKHIGQFVFIYSFATRSSNSKLLEYYQNHIDDLSRLGDFGYKLIHNIYSKYHNPEFNMPLIVETTQIKRPSLKLIANNIERLK